MPERATLPRSARLLSKAQFARVFRTRRRYDTELFSVHHAPAERARLGMAVSRRVSSRAVVRNRVRRQIRESFRLARGSLKPFDFVVVARPAAATADRRFLRDTLDAIWQRFSDDT
jgi:ribonuclease P protein component